MTETPASSARRQSASIGPFAVAKELVARLGDEALRTLLGKLLEAEAAATGVPFAGIDLGGHQDARDGGVDAALHWSGSPAPRDWLPRRTMFFQSKAQAMRPADVTAEMRPSGVLRPIFTELAAAGGAYVIFSNADAGLKSVEARLVAMRAALSDLPYGERIYVGFLPADRIARWVNQHPGVAMWLLEQSGQPLTGWRPHESWSAPAAKGAQYLTDGETRASFGHRQMDIRDAIAEMREALAEERSVVRLVGRSGMGKTRLAEALFDGEVAGGVPLPRALAIYGDATHDNLTNAVLIAEKLAISGSDAILIVDNCPADLHARLSRIVERPGSVLRLLTIDFDVGNDRDLTGKTVRLEPGSDALIEALLEQRYPALTSGSRRRLARFAGGNARVALAIANRAMDDADLAPLNDRELIDRLFQTGRDDEADVRPAAAAASLVIAFYAEETEEHPAEYAFLAEVAGLTPQRFFRAVRIMLDWGIAQQRGAQRAIKPDPIANHLAGRMLGESDPAALVVVFARAPERLFASFARRLGQAARSPETKHVAERLLTGWLAGPIRAHGERYRAFEGIIPAAPQAALRALEKEFANVSDQEIKYGVPEYRGLTQLLGILASLPAAFHDAMLLLVRYALREGSENDAGCPATFEFLSKFDNTEKYTYVPDDALWDFLDHMLAGADDRVKSLALKAMQTMLTEHRGRSRNAVPADNPNAPQQVEIIYAVRARKALGRLSSIVSTDKGLADEARNIIAGRLQENVAADIVTDFLKAMHAVQPQCFWDDGWSGVGAALGATRNSDPQKVRGALTDFYKRLAPRTLEDWFAAFVMAEARKHTHPTRRDSYPFRNSALLSRATGRAAVREKSALPSLIARATIARRPNHVVQFAEGMAREIEEIGPVWELAFRAYKIAPAEERLPGVLVGLMREVNRRPKDGWCDWSQKLLDKAAVDRDLRPWIGALHHGRQLDANDLLRLTRAVKDRRTKVEEILGALHPLVGRPMQDALARLLKKALARSGGSRSALHAMHWQVEGLGNLAIESDELLLVAKAILLDRECYWYGFERADDLLADIAGAVFRSDFSAELPVAICRAIREARDVCIMSERSHWALVKALMECRPQATLDELVGDFVPDEASDLSYFVTGADFSNDTDEARLSVPSLNEADLFTWVAGAPQARTVRLAGLVRYCSQTNGDHEHVAWTRLALGLLRAAPDPVPVLQAFERRMTKTSGRGPHAFRFLRRHALAKLLASDPDKRIRDWANGAAERMKRLAEGAELERDDGVFE